MFIFKLARNLTLVSFVLFNLSLFAADEAVEEIVVTGSLIKIIGVGQ